MLKQDTSRISFLIVLQYIVFGSAILYFGRPLLVPLCFGVLISCVLYPVCHWLERHKVKRMVAILIAISGVSILLIGVVALLISQLVSFSTTWPALLDKVTSSSGDLSVWLLETLNISKEQQVLWLKNILNQSGGDAMALIQKTISASAVSAVLFILIPIYAVLILYYRQRWIDVLFHLFPNEGRERIREILHLSIQSYYNFIKGMALVYLIVGLLNSLGLYFIGIPQSFLFGFVAAILTFIPYVGILVGSLLPISMAWITYNSIWYPLGVVALFAFVQYLEANVIFPLAVSTRLKVNTLITIVAIIAGGILWGVAGMILFIPFLGILKLIADRTPSMKTVGLILGDES
jgi:predicted PurR-regulated permease PerM